MPQNSIVSLFWIREIGLFVSGGGAQKYTLMVNLGSTYVPNTQDVHSGFCARHVK